MDPSLWGWLPVSGSAVAGTCPPGISVSFLGAPGFPTEHPQCLSPPSAPPNFPGSAPPHIPGIPTRTPVPPEQDVPHGPPGLAQLQLEVKGPSTFPQPLPSEGSSQHFPFARQERKDPAHLPPQPGMHRGCGWLRVSGARSWPALRPRAPRPRNTSLLFALPCLLPTHSVNSTPRGARPAAPGPRLCAGLCTSSSARAGGGEREAVVLARLPQAEGLGGASRHQVMPGPSLRVAPTAHARHVPASARALGVFSLSCLGSHSTGGETEAGLSSCMLCPPFTPHGQTCGPPVHAEAARRLSWAHREVGAPPASPLGGSCS